MASVTSWLLCHCHMHDEMIQAFSTRFFVIQDHYKDRDGSLERRDRDSEYRRRRDSRSPVRRLKSR